jgi:uncharacterized protein with HEPN domain
MSREWRLYLEDIRHACEKIRRFTRGMTADQFRADERPFDAVVRNLEIIGEAAKHIPDATRAHMSKVPWRKIAGMRDWRAHTYFGIDFDILWDVVRNKVPELLRQVSSFEKKIEATGSQAPPQEKVNLFRKLLTRP